MAVVAYSMYRLMITRNHFGGSDYFTVNEFGLYESVNHDTPNLCIGAVASATSQFSSYGPGQAIDGNPGTFWESGGASEAKYLQVVLPEAKAVRSMYLSCTTYIAESPRDFKLLGSNDGASWVEIADFKDWTTGAAKSSYESLAVRVGGISQLDVGLCSVRVVLHDWETMNFIGAVIPAADGTWSCRVSNTRDLLVTHIGPSGYQPWSDGPVTPYGE